MRLNNISKIKVGLSNSKKTLEDHWIIDHFIIKKQIKNTLPNNVCFL